VRFSSRGFLRRHPQTVTLFRDNESCESFASRHQITEGTDSFVC